MDQGAVTEAIERYKQYQIWKTSPLVTAEAMAKLQDMLVASAVMKETARVKYEDVVVADFAKKVPRNRGAVERVVHAGAGRIRQPDRAKRLWQEHLAVADCRTDPADLGRRADRRPGRDQAQSAHRLHAAAGLPV
ncbi:hypothetical protein G6F65_021354 [Rhizopus arrhizus]|nr:hypothetical protein G6F65_021354 [Rhizopus arrhizus]